MGAKALARPTEHSNKTQNTPSKGNKQRQCAGKEVKDSSLVAVQLTNESAHRLIRHSPPEGCAAYLHYDDKAT